MDYKLHGHMKFQGLPISVENRAGSERHWTDDSTGETGSTTMKHPYGYIKGTLGTDGDEVDVYVGPYKDSPKVFVITQNQKPESGMAGSQPWVDTDEQKVMLGFDNAKEAQAAYMDHYDDPRFFGHMIELRMDDFRDRLSTHRGKIIKGFISGVVSKLRALATKYTRKKDPSEEAAKEHFKDYHPKYTNKKDDDGDGEADRFYNAWVNHHRNTTSKALKETPTPAILFEDNTPMLVLSKSDAQKAFKPVALKSGSEESRMNKAKMVDTEEDAEKGFPSGDKAKFKANAKDSDKDKVPDGLDKDPKDAGSRKSDMKKGDPGPKQVSSSQSFPLTTGAGKDNPGGVSAVARSMASGCDEEEDLEKVAPVIATTKSVAKSLREQAIATLQAGADRRPAPEQPAVVEAPQSTTDSLNKSLGIDLNKALRAIAVAGMSRRARMDAAFQLGRSVGRSKPVIQVEPVSISVNVGSDRVRPIHEPPVAPLRRVPTPPSHQPAQASHSSCTVHGYVHKSDSPCTLCVQAEVHEAGPLWRR